MNDFFTNEKYCFFVVIGWAVRFFQVLLKGVSYDFKIFEV